ncbi:riboflavin synthase [Marinobacterium maritimum]|uniref:Riboflavin synthase n=1 Tax=Marinobacterium maritimum TaxID=500162 RepID=A0ABN1I434_9GAMM
MFTGIVQGMAQVTGCERNGGIMKLALELPPAQADNLALGASIAINGTCLTITEFNGSHVCFDVIDTSLQLTNLGQLAVGDRVNFERAARIGDEIGGHLMSGHILCRADIIEVSREGDNRKIRFATPAEAAPYLLPKGFVGLNGCSLTLAEVEQDSFSISLIPETVRQTTFGLLEVGDCVNLEVDPQTQAVVDTVQRYMALQSVSAS